MTPGRAKKYITCSKQCAAKHTDSKREKFIKICPICGKEHPFENMHGDHIVEWSKGGRTVVENLQMVCHGCHKELTRTMFD